MADFFRVFARGESYDGYVNFNFECAPNSSNVMFHEEIYLREKVSWSIVYHYLTISTTKKKGEKSLLSDLILSKLRIDIQIKTLLNSFAAKWLEIDVNIDDNI